MKKTGRPRVNGYEDERVRTTIHVPGKLLELFDRYAYEHNWTRSSLLEGMMWEELKTGGKGGDLVTK